MYYGQRLWLLPHFAELAQTRARGQPQTWEMRCVLHMHGQDATAAIHHAAGVTESCYGQRLWLLPHFAEFAQARARGQPHTWETRSPHAWAGCDSCHSSPDRLWLLTWTPG